MLWILHLHHREVPVKQRIWGLLIDFQVWGVCYFNKNGGYVQWNVRHDMNCNCMTLKGRSKYALVIQFDLFEPLRLADQTRGRHIIEKKTRHTHTHIYLDNRDWHGSKKHHQRRIAMSSQTPDTAEIWEIGSRTRLLCTNTPHAPPQREAVDMHFLGGGHVIDFFPSYTTQMLNVWSIYLHLP